LRVATLALVSVMATACCTDYTGCFCGASARHFEHPLSGYYEGEILGCFPPFGDIRLRIDGSGRYQTWIRQLALPGQSTLDPFVTFSSGRLESRDGHLMLIDEVREGIRSEYAGVSSRFDPHTGELVFPLHWGKTRYFASFDGEARVNRILGEDGRPARAFIESPKYPTDSQAPASPR
jgi:hypothetical protein